MQPAQPEGRHASDGAVAEIFRPGLLDLSKEFDGHVGVLARSGTRENPGALVAGEPDAPCYHYAPDSTTLQTVFQEVANYLSELRLSK